MTRAAAHVLLASATLVLLTSVAELAAAQPAAVLRVTVRGSGDAPVADATVRAAAGRSCVTDGAGACRIVLDVGADPRPVALRTTAIGFAPDVRTVVASPGRVTPIAVALRPGAAPLDRVVTIGTRGPDRTVAGSPVPVDVVSSALLEGTGLPETWQQLQRLVPSVHVPHVPIGDNHARPVTLRGLAPHHALVLVNGRRRHPAAALLAGPAVPFTGYTDLAPLPTTAIDRVEVLRDGAAAQYGSDAIGGVVNVVLRTGARRDLRVTAGRTVSTEGGREFDDGRLVQASGTLGVGTVRGGHLTVSIEVRDRGATNRAYPDRRPQYFAGDRRAGAPARVSSHLGDGAMRQLAMFASAAVPLGERAEAYAFGGVADRDGASPDAFFRRPLDPRTVRAIHPDGFLPVVESRIADASTVAGVRRRTARWDWHASAGWGGNRVAQAVRNTVNASLGAASPTAFDAGGVAVQQWTANLDAVRAARVGGRGASVAGGAELRLEHYALHAGEPDAWRDGGMPIADGPAAGQPAAAGAQGLVGVRPVDAVRASRRSAALYADVEARPHARLLVQPAARVERYDDVGTTSVGKLAARVDVGLGLAVRGSLGTAFRAPSLAQQHFASTRTVFRPVGGVNTVLAVRTFPVSSPEARLLGATPLRPERSLNRSAGLVLRAARLPLVTADAYDIRIADRIVLGGSVTDTAIVRRFAEHGMRGVGGGNYFANAVDTRTRGLDVVASHAVPLGGGVLRMLGGYNRTRTVVTHVRPPPPELARLGSVLFDRTSRGILERGQPRETMTLAVQYVAGRWDLDLHNRRAGPTAQLDQASPDADQVVRARWVTDARVAYRLRPRLHAAAVVANLRDAYPDEWRDFADGVQARGASMQGIFRHPGGLSPFGMNGRTVYVQLAYR